MKKVLITVVIVLGLGLAGFIYYSYTLARDKDAMAAELQITQNTLVSTQEQLAFTSQTLADTQQELSLKQLELGSTRVSLASTESSLDTAQKQLVTTEAELETHKQTLNLKLTELNTANDKIKSLSGLQDTLVNTQKKLVTAQETLSGLGITIAASLECYDVKLVDNPEANNPSWNELKAFLRQDKTEEHTYIINEYDCSQFSRDLHNRAEAAGIRTAEVHVEFENEKTGHALNAFLTTDSGLVFIDCTQLPDKVSRLVAKKTYRAASIDWMLTGSYIRNEEWWDSLMFFYYIASSTGGQAVTSSIIIYW